MTIRELSKLLGVSPSAISIVLNGKKGVSEETREMILKAMKEHNYHPAAKKTSIDRTVILIKYYKSGYFVEENQGFISMIIDSIEGELRKKKIGMHMTIIKKNLEQGLDEIEYDKYMGAIVIGTELFGEEYELLRKISIPFVVVDNTVPNYNYSSVCMNNMENVYIAMKCLKDFGHQKIGYIGSKLDTENFRERRLGFEWSIQQLGMEVDSENEYSVTPTMVGAHDDFVQILEKKRIEKATFFAENDTIALGVIKALKEKKYKIPEQISIIGFDDIAYSSISSPALTTIHVQRKHIGKQAVFQLLNQVESTKVLPIKSKITGELRWRDSVKALL